MSGLVFDLDEINWDEVVDRRFDLAFRACETLTEAMNLLGETCQIRYLRCLIHHGCVACRIQVRCSDRRLLWVVLRFELGDGIAAEYDSASGIVYAYLDDIECVSMPLSGTALQGLAEMIRQILQKEQNVNCWQTISDENGIITLQLVH